jgi:hypothetical protein
MPLRGPTSATRGAIVNDSPPHFFHLCFRRADQHAQIVPRSDA